MNGGGAAKEATTTIPSMTKPPSATGIAKYDDIETTA